MTPVPAAAPIVIRLARSRLLLSWLLVIHLFAAGCAAMLPLGPEWTALLLAAVAGSLGWQLWSRVASRAPWSIREVACSDRGWHLQRADGRRRPARLLGDTWVSTGLVVLRFRVGRWPRSLVLSADAVGADPLRRLRARLRLVGADTRSDPARAGPRGSASAGRLR